MPAAQQSTGAIFTDFEEKRWNLRIVSGLSDYSEKTKANQHKFGIAIEGYEDPERGGEVIRHMWTSEAWNESEEKPSHQYLLARAVCGPSVTLEQWERLDYPDMVGMRFSALVALNAGGWPTVNKDSIKAPMGSNPAPKNQAALPQTAPATPAANGGAAPAQAQLPNKPTRPNFKPRADTNLRTAEQRDELLSLGLENDPPMSAEDMNAWIASEYPGKTLDTITPEQAETLIRGASVPF
jgi:hypothetical protein